MEQDGGLIAQIRTSLEAELATAACGVVLCHEAKTLYFPNGHYEGPIDFFDQSF